MVIATPGTTANGGALTLQAPCGNGDSNLDASEWITVSAPSVAVGAAPGAPHRFTIRMRSTNPARGVMHAAIELGNATHAVVDLLDVRGRRVERLFQGEARGMVEVATSSARKLAAGMYFLSVRTGRASAARRVVVLP